MIKILLAVLLFASCVNNVKTNEAKDSITSMKGTVDTILPKESSEKTDTTISYDIDGISSEGAEATAHYHNKSIVNATMSVFGETGKAEYKFFFDNDSVHVQQWIYKYTKPITEPDFEETKPADSTACILITKNGHLIRGNNNEALNITYLDFLKAVPLKLK